MGEYAHNGILQNPSYFTGNGIPGTRYDQPGFMAMMEEAKGENAEYIVFKDMSRLGRDCGKAGQIMEGQRKRVIAKTYTVL